MKNQDQLEQQYAEVRQIAAKQRVELRDLGQQLLEERDRLRTTRGEVERLRLELKTINSKLKLETVDRKKYGEMERALAGVVAHRYAEVNPFGCDCGYKWCAPCTIKVWARVNLLAGKPSLDKAAVGNPTVRP